MGFLATLFKWFFTHFHSPLSLIFHSHFPSTFHSTFHSYSLVFVLLGVSWARACRLHRSFGAARGACVVRSHLLLLAVDREPRLCQVRLDAVFRLKMAGFLCSVGLFLVAWLLIFCFVRNGHAGKCATKCSITSPFGLIPLDTTYW